MYRPGSGRGHVHVVTIAFFLVAIIWGMQQVMGARCARGRRSHGDPPRERPILGRACVALEWGVAKCCGGVVRAGIPVALRRRLTDGRRGAPHIVPTAVGQEGRPGRGQSARWAWPIVAAIIVVLWRRMGAIAFGADRASRWGSRGGGVSASLFLATFAPSLDPVGVSRDSLFTSLPCHSTCRLHRPGRRLVTIGDGAPPMRAMALPSAPWRCVARGLVVRDERFSLQLLADPAFRTGRPSRGVQYLQSKWRPGDVLLVNAELRLPVCEVLGWPHRRRTRLTERRRHAHDAELLMVTSVTWTESQTSVGAIRCPTSTRDGERFFFADTAVDAILSASQGYVSIGLRYSERSGRSHRTDLTPPVA